MRNKAFFALLSCAFLALAANVASAQSWKELQTSTDEAALIQAITNVGDAPEDIHNVNVACKRLAVYGTDAAIPALVALLPNEKQNFNARFALEAMPSEAVDAALLKAAKELKGTCLVGVIDTIGVRGKADSFATLKEIAEANDDPAVQRAIYAACGMWYCTVMANFYEIAQSSGFCFTILEDRWDERTKTDTITRVGKLYDVSAVSIPANPGTEISTARKAFLDGVIREQRAERLAAEERAKKIRILQLRAKAARLRKG